MSKRNDIINSLIAHIENAVGFRGFRGIRFLHEVQSFPAFYIHPRGENRTHNSRGAKQAIISCDLRVYTWSDNQDTIEAVARSIEAAIQAYAEQYRSLVHEARVTSLRTDEGLMEPYSLCDVSLQLLYGINDE